MANNAPLVAIVAGEASGDQHAACLVREVKRVAPQVRFCGIAGPRMRAAGAESLFDTAALAVVGLVEILSHFKAIYSALRKMRRFLREERPDLLILVDYPEFNLRLAKTAKALGIKVLYYISPQVWAWRQYRVRRIGRLVDVMGVILPFEAPFYKHAGIPAYFVGHPLQQEVKSAPGRVQARRKLGLDPRHKVLGLLPGSRRGEIARLLPVLLEAAEQIALEEPEIRFLLPLASTLTEADLIPYLEGHRLPLKIIPNRSYEVMAACDAIVAASGTATLEVALMEVPLIVLYKMNPFSYWIGRLLVKVKYIALCNIIAGEGIVPELIQQDASPERVVLEVRGLLSDQGRVEAMRREFYAIKERLGAGAHCSIAELTLSLLENEEPGSAT